MNLAVKNNNTENGLGTIKNRLGFLSSDLQGFNPNRFLDLTGLKAVDAAQALGKTRTAMYKDFIPFKPSDELKKKIIDLVIASDIAFLLFNKDEKETARWIVAPNTFLFGSTPFEICLRGDGTPLIKWLFDRAGQVIPDFKAE